MNEKRKRFLATFAVQVKGIRDKKFNEENIKMKPIVGEIADGYKSFINDLGGGFLEFVEAYNQCIQIAKKNKVVENVALKARIKDFSSSFRNTDAKLLDDVFGMQIVTGKKLEKDKKELTSEEKEQAEVEKEFFMLFNHLILEIEKHKKYNKNNGYLAYHCTGDLNLKIEDLENRIKDIIENANAREYIYSKHEPQYEKDRMVNLFPNLLEKIKNPEELKLITNSLKQMVELMQRNDIKKEQTPLMEFHFMTTDVEEVATRGTAKHSTYKNSNAKLIRQFFNDGRLFRGINAPWKFDADENGIHMQDFYITLLENWPFLGKSIEIRKKYNKDKSDARKSDKFDRLLASQFPFLRKYIETKDSQYPEKYQQEKWGVLKGILVANRIDFNRGFEEDLGKTIFDSIEEIW